MQNRTFGVTERYWEYFQGLRILIEMVTNFKVAIPSKKTKTTKRKRYSDALALRNKNKIIYMHKNNDRGGKQKPIVFDSILLDLDVRELQK